MDISLAKNFMPQYGHDSKEIESFKSVNKSIKNTLLEFFHDSVE